MFWRKKKPPMLVMCSEKTKFWEWVSAKMNCGELKWEEGEQVYRAMPFSREDTETGALIFGDATVQGLYNKYLGG